MKYSIGAVTFKVNGKVPKITEGLYGKDRKQALLKFYRGEDLGKLEPFVFGFGPIKWEDVNWETAGFTND